MTLKEALQYRGITLTELARCMDIRTVAAKGWIEGRMGRVTMARLQTLAKMLDGGILITEDGVEFELYGGGRE